PAAVERDRPHVVQRHVVEQAVAAEVELEELVRVGAHASINPRRLVEIALLLSRAARPDGSIPASMRRLLLCLLVLGTVGTGIAIAQGSVLEGVIGPDNHVQPSGRRLEPPGTLTKLGNHPAGGALTPDGRFLWTLSA